MHFVVKVKIPVMAVRYFYAAITTQWLLSLAAVDFPFMLIVAPTSIS